MRRRMVELAVVLVAAMGVEAREASLRAREPIYCAPIRAGNSTERFLRGVEMTGVGLGAGGGTRVPPLQIKGGAPAAEDGALKGRRYTGSGEAPSAEKSSGEESGPRAGGTIYRAPTMATAVTTEGEFVVKDFRFRDGETLAELRLHYATLGKPARDAAGRVTNAVLLLHGTGGSGAQFLQAQFAGELFGAGQLLDTAKYYIILPDGIGHGKSSKPSDGLHAFVCVGGNVSGVYGRADAAGVPAGADCGAQSCVAEDGDGRDSERSGVEGRGVQRGAEAGAAHGVGFAADRGERAAADAEDAANAGCGGQISGRVFCGADARPRCQRLAVRGERFAELRSVAGAGENSRAGDVCEFGGRFYQSAGAGDRGAGDSAGRGRAICGDTD